MNIGPDPINYCGSYLHGVYMSDIKVNTTTASLACLLLFGQRIVSNLLIFPPSRASGVGGKMKDPGNEVVL